MPDEIKLGLIFQALYGLAVVVALFLASIVFASALAFGVTMVGCFAVVMSQTWAMRGDLRGAVLAWWLSIAAFLLAFLALLAKGF